MNPTSRTLFNSSLTLEEKSFIEDRKYLKNVTPATLQWYLTAFKTFEGCTTLPEFRSRIVTLRESGRSPVSINTWLRVMNAYLHWQVAPQKKCSPACEHLRIPKLREEERILQTFSPAQLGLILKARPTSLNAQRAQILAIVILDTGLRIREVLSLQQGDVDLDTSLLTVLGKGRKERQVPLSQEGRRWLYRWMASHPTQSWVFGTSTGTSLSVRNAQRDLGRWLRGLGLGGIRCSPHTLRHTFAVSYLRAGGNLEYLRRILGHSSILITQRYLKSLSPEDLGKVHNSLSPLANC